MTDLSTDQLPVRAPVSVIGYHGCDVDVAGRLLAGEPFRFSGNDYDWLGSGVYFWEYAPYRAKEWAQQRFGENWAVLKAEILLGDCLNLLDTDYFEDLRIVHARVVANLQRLDVDVPDNKRGANRLDRLIIDRFGELHRARGGFFDTIRGCFPEGTPIYQGSKLLSHTHVQMAVRNQACIKELELVNYA